MTEDKDEVRGIIILSVTMAFVLSVFFAVLWHSDDLKFEEKKIKYMHCCEKKCAE